MKDPVTTPSPTFLESVSRRAKRFLSITKQPKPKPEKRVFTRAELRLSERSAHRALAESKHGPCAQLARDLIDIAVSVDNLWVEIYPVFEMIDTKIKQEHCQLLVDQEGYRLVDPQGQTVSKGTTLRSWLTSHVYQRGDRVTGEYSRDSE